MTAKFPMEGWLYHSRWSAESCFDLSPWGADTDPHLAEFFPPWLDLASALHSEGRFYVKLCDLHAR